MGFPCADQRIAAHQNATKLKPTEKLGTAGEDLAAAHLRDHGYEVLQRNWRFGKAELDIIAFRNGVLVFVEVKTRSQTHFGQPEESLTAYQQEMLVFAAQAYLDQSGHEGEIRFDLIAILWPKGESPSLKHIEDAFFPGL